MLSPLSASVAAVPVKVCVEDPARLKRQNKPEQTQNRLKTMMEFPLIRQLSRPVAVMEVVEVTVLVWPWAAGGSCVTTGLTV